MLAGNETRDYYEDKAANVGTLTGHMSYENGMRLMALDTPSPDDGSAINNISDEDSPNHKFMLKKGVIIVEYLCNTDKLDLNKKYEIFALPLKIIGSDGAPARVIVREI